MFIISSSISKDDRVELLHDVKVIKGTSTAGHKFRVVAIGDRGLDLVDDDGHELIECSSSFVKKLA